MFVLTKIKAQEHTISIPTSWQVTVNPVHAEKYTIPTYFVRKNTHAHAEGVDQVSCPWPPTHVTFINRDVSFSSVFLSSLLSSLFPALQFFTPPALPYASLLTLTFNSHLIDRQDKQMGDRWDIDEFQLNLNHAYATWTEAVTFVRRNQLWFLLLWCGEF